MGNKAQTAGILTIITGSMGILGSLALFALVPLIHTAMIDPALQTDSSLTVADIKAAADLMAGILSFMAIFGLVLAVFIIISGVYALKRKAWGLGLAGSIAGLFVFFPTAVPALVFMALAKPEFERPALPSGLPTAPSSSPAEPLSPPHA
jgi:hypothetical protein